MAAQSFHILRFSAAACESIALSVCGVKRKGLATCTILKLLSLLKEYSSLKVVQSIKKKACEIRIMVQNVFHICGRNISVCTPYVHCEGFMLTWNSLGYRNIQMSKLRIFHTY